MIGSKSRNNMHKHIDKRPVPIVFKVKKEGIVQKCTAYACIGVDGVIHSQLQILFKDRLDVSRLG